VFTNRALDVFALSAQNFAMHRAEGIVFLLCLRDCGKPLGLLGRVPAVPLANILRYAQSPCLCRPGPRGPLSNILHFPEVEVCNFAALQTRPTSEITDAVGDLRPKRHD